MLITSPFENDSPLRISQWYRPCWKPWELPRIRNCRYARRSDCLVASYGSCIAFEITDMNIAAFSYIAWYFIHTWQMWTLQRVSCMTAWKLHRSQNHRCELLSGQPWAVWALHRIGTYSCELCSVFLVRQPWELHRLCKLQLGAFPCFSCTRSNILATGRYQFAVW